MKEGYKEITMRILITIITLVSVTSNIFTVFIIKK